MVLSSIWKCIEIHKRISVPNSIYFLALNHNVLAERAFQSFKSGIKGRRTVPMRSLFHLSPVILLYCFISYRILLKSRESSFLDLYNRRKLAFANLL